MSFSEKNSTPVWVRASLDIQSTIAEVIANLDEVAIKIVLVVDAARELVGTISDGDVRRGLLAGLTLQSSISQIIHRNPLVVKSGLDQQSVIKIMERSKVLQIPVVDDMHKLIGLHLWEDLTESSKIQNVIVVMAGGEGKRLRPYTLECPKPLIKVADKPILQHIVEKIKSEGFENIVLSINYLGQMIQDYFEDGSKFGVSIKYINEASPLGTAGSLSLLIPAPRDPIIVINGDLITNVSIQGILRYHNQNSACATMAVRQHEWQNPFGVVQLDKLRIIGFEEKPIYSNYVNAGLYVLSPSAIEQIEKDGVYCDMPDLFLKLKSSSQKVIAYPLHEKWIDVGCHEDLLSAEEGSKDKI